MVRLLLRSEQVAEDEGGDEGREAVAAALRGAAGQGGLVDLGGPPYTADDVAATLGRVVGRPVQTVEIPQEQHVGALIESGFSPQIAAVFAEMYAFFLAGKAQPVGDRIVKFTFRMIDRL